MIKIVLKDIDSMGDIPLNPPDYLENDRWKKIQKLRATADKKRSLASGYLLDYMCRDMQISNPVYDCTERGKPVLKGVESAFNISHSGEYAVLAYHKTQEPIGVDIQKIRTMRKGMEERILHEKEFGCLPENEEEKRSYLNRLWAAKESFVKMTGQGLACDFRTICVDFEAGIIIGNGGEKAYIMVWNWKNDYFLSVCTGNREECELTEI